MEMSKEDNKSFFNKDFRKEDLFLYVVALGLMVFFGYYFVQSREIATRVMDFDSKQVLTDRAYNFEVFRYKYDFATRALALNSMRNNILFMVGSILCLLGTMIVVRRLRDSVEAGLDHGNVAFSFKTSSPGVYLAVLGFLLLLMPLVLKDEYSITEGGTEIKYEKPYNGNKTTDDGKGIQPE